VTPLARKVKSELVKGKEIVKQTLGKSNWIANIE
jgi:hypothetical protein